MRSDLMFSLAVFGLETDDGAVATKCATLAILEHMSDKGRY